MLVTNEMIGKRSYHVIIGTEIGEHMHTRTVDEEIGEFIGNSLNAWYNSSENINRDFWQSRVWISTLLLATYCEAKSRYGSL